MFTPGQVVLMFIVTIILVYSLLSKMITVLSNIYAIRKYTKLVMSGIISSNEFYNILKRAESNKEERLK